MTSCQNQIVARLKVKNGGGFWCYVTDRQLVAKQMDSYDCHEYFYVEEADGTECLLGNQCRCARQRSEEV